MARILRDKEALAPLCRRFIQLMKDDLAMGRTKLARELGYANPSTLLLVEKGKTFPDIAKLQRLSLLRTAAGASPNLDWLITGEGKPVLFRTTKPETQEENDRLAAEMLLHRLTSDQIRSLLHLFGR